MANEVLCSHAVTDNGGQPAIERLRDHQPEAFFQRRQHKDRGIPECICQFSLSDRAMKSQPGFASVVRQIVFRLAKDCAKKIDIPFFFPRQLERLQQRPDALSQPDLSREYNPEVLRRWILGLKKHSPVRPVWNHPDLFRIDAE